MSLQPSPAQRDEATRHLSHWLEGDGSARERLFMLVRSELRSVAEGLLRKERPGHTLQPTALVHEAWLRLIRVERTSVEGKTHFLGLAARAMRHVLVDHARAKRRAKRGGHHLRVDMPEDPPGARASPPLDLIALDRSIERLEGRSEHLARVVELRFFGGLSQEESAAALGISVATLGRDWKAARALLARYMHEELGTR